MSNRVFVYETLKSKAVREKALNIRHDVPHEPAKAIGWVETFVTYKNQKWPTLFAFPHRFCWGEILEINNADLDKLDRWENYYKRRLIMTDLGRVWTYIFKKE